MDLLALLAVLLVGVILGYWLQNPALAERERHVRITLRQAKATLAEAAVKLAISADQLRLVKAVREQTVAMLDEHSGDLKRTMPAAPVDLDDAPVYASVPKTLPLPRDFSFSWLAPLAAGTGAFPVIAQDEPELAGVAS